MMSDFAPLATWSTAYAQSQIRRFKVGELVTYRGRTYQVDSYQGVDCFDIGTGTDRHVSCIPRLALVEPGKEWFECETVIVSQQDVRRA